MFEEINSGEIIIISHASNLPNLINLLPSAPYPQCETSSSGVNVNIPFIPSRLSPDSMLITCPSVEMTTPRNLWTSKEADYYLCASMQGKKNVLTHKFYI